MNYFFNALLKLLDIPEALPPFDWISLCSLFVRLDSGIKFSLFKITTYHNKFNHEKSPADAELKNILAQSIGVAPTETTDCITAV